MHQPQFLNWITTQNHTRTVVNKRRNTTTLVVDNPCHANPPPYQLPGAYIPDYTGCALRDLVSRYWAHTPTTTPIPGFPGPDKLRLQNIALDANVAELDDNRKLKQDDSNHF